MDIIPQSRRSNGIDEFMLVKAAQELLKDMERNHWNKGEVEKFPQVLEDAIKKNSERIRVEKLFTLWVVITDEKTETATGQRK